MQEDAYQGDGLNLYAYCGNNPVVYYDPSGYKFDGADYSLIKIDTDGNGYAYYQNRDYSNALNNRGWSEYYEGSSFQAHHLLQGKWATKNLQDYGYDYRRAPTISLGTGYYTNDSGDKVAAPHTIVNNRQTQREYARGRGDFSTTLDSELAFGATDLLNAGMSEKIVMSELERNYKMLDALNEQNRVEIEAGHLNPLAYDREGIEKAVHETAEQKRQQEEEIKSNNC